MTKRILAIESSCDETSAAIVDEQGTILSNVVASQAGEHASTMGVVPEVAARRHASAIVPTIELALQESTQTREDITHIAVTATPGLLPALQVGVVAAKALATAWKLPLIPVNHLDAHIATTFVQDPEPQFPAVSLLVSGGHTELSFHPDKTTRTILGRTRDDAGGEAFDKVARMMGLPYPGGPQIAKLLPEGDKQRFSFPRPMLNDQSDDFSFSGIKTDVKRVIDTLPQPLSHQNKADVAASFAEAMTETLVGKTVRAALREGAASVILSGGVAADKYLRQVLTEELQQNGLELYVPPISLCGDNAAMIGIAALWADERPVHDAHATPTSRTRRKKN